MKNTGCSLLLALLLCGCAASPAVVPFHYDNGPDYVREGLNRIVDDRGRMGYADESGRVVEVLCTYDPDSRGGDPADGRKVKGATLHWVDAENCLDAEVRLYDNLFSDATPDGPDKDFLDCLNPDSLTVLTGCKVEPEMRKVAEAFDKQENRTGVNAPTFQFMRVGYFCMDNRDCTAEHLVFDRSVSLKDSFKK